MKQPIQPIFLFCIPRSGSTLLQRILATHPGVATTAEPWLLLPLLSAIRKEGIYANYDHSAAVDAIKGFYSSLEESKLTFENEIRDFALKLYAQQSNQNTIYFLDKTPRYHLIVEHIIEVFTNARFIFLWRNPLSIISSMIKTWHDDQWNIHFFKVDLYDGMESLINSYTTHSDRVIGVNYEALIREPEKVCISICDYLNLPFHQEMIEDFQSVELPGEMGDTTGVKTYQSISLKPIEKWKQTLNNPLRKKWCRSYLDWLGPERLELIGYNYPDLLKELKEIRFSTRRLGHDILHSMYGQAYQFLELRLLQDKVGKYKKGQHKYNHPHL